MKINIVILLTFFMPINSFLFAQNLDKKQYIFLGNDGLAPISYLENSKPAGIFIDLTKALAKQTGLNIKIKLMDWSKAQSLLLHNKADALIYMNATEQRRKKYDFSDILLKSDFYLFKQYNRNDIQDLRSLFGLKVAIELKGYPQDILKKYPTILVKKVPTLQDGFQLLEKRKVDAVISDKWAGEYFLATNHLNNIVAVNKPIASIYSRIAVKKGNSALLQKINKGIEKIRNDESMKKILQKWDTKKVVYFTQQQYNYFMIFFIATLVILLLFFIIIFYMYKIKLLNRSLKNKQHELEKKQTIIENIAYYDSLTGIYNRHKFNEIWAEEIERIKRYRHPICIAIVDIDKFKRFNDTYGHLVGDEVLTMVARVIAENIRNTDIVTRWGGEEFTILFRNTSIQDAKIACDKLRVAIENLKHPIAESITASFGLSQYRETDTQETIFKRCDTALYKAKNSGRNCVVLYS